MQTIWMVIDIIFFGRMILDNGFMIFKKQVFNKAHLIPCRRSYCAAYRHMVPTPPVAYNNCQQFAFRSRDPKQPIISKRTIRFKRAFFDPVFLYFIAGSEFYQTKSGLLGTLTSLLSDEYRCNAAAQ